MKFSIRDLLLVTMLVALVLGWWVDRSKLLAEIERLSPKEITLESLFSDSGSFPRLPDSSAPAPIPAQP